MSLSVENYIDIAPNEYVTKYSFNRNFEKLILNDIALSAKAGSSSNDVIDALSKAQTYNKYKVYTKGDYVFYKISKSSTSFYILKSNKNGNTHMPCVRKNEYTGNMYVINSDYWKILGISVTNKASLPKDQADDYITTSTKSFEDTHELNTTVHPTGLLNSKQSKKLLATFENIADESKNFFYPSYLQAFVSDNTTYSGYMRKWNNGILEYDVVYRLSYLSTDNQGIDLLSANNVDVLHRNKNYLYFKEDSDYGIFNQGGDAYTMTTTTKQINLNDKVNAYSGKIRFVEPFKDLNYMVFTSNFKQIEVDAKNSKNSILSGYDPRLDIDGLMIVGTTPYSVFKTACEIPNEVVNIKSYALAVIEQIDDWPVEFILDPWNSKLMNIDPFAFNATGIASMTIPASVRYIGKYAFLGCGYLQSLNIYQYSDLELSANALVIGDKAFESTSVAEINIYYKKKAPTNNTQHILYDWLSNNANREAIGIMNEVTINCYDIDVVSAKPMPKTMLAQSPNAIDADVVQQQNVFDNIAENEAQISINVKDFFAKFATAPTINSPKRSKKALLGAPKPDIDINSVFKMSDTAITGYDNSNIIGEIGFNLGDLATEPTSIRQNALNNFTQLTSLTCNSTLTSIYLGNLPNLKTLSIDVSGNCNTAIGNSINGNSLSVYVSMLSTQNFTLNANTIDLLKISADPSTTGILTDNTYLSSNSLSITRVNTLCVEGIRGYAPSAFGSISSIGNCILNGCAAETFISNNLFCVMHDDGDYVDVDNLQLAGSGWKLMDNSLYLLNQNYLSISNYNYLYIAQKALSNVSLGTLALTELPASNVKNILSTNFMSNCSVMTFAMPDATFFSKDPYKTIGSIVSSSWKVTESDTIVKGALSATDLISYGFTKGTYITDQTSGYYILDCQANYTVSSETTTKSCIDSFLGYDSIPGYFEVVDGTILKSFNGNAGGWQPPYVAIPNYITSISANAFANKTSADQIQAIYVPNSVLSVGNNAFKGLSNLQNLVFQQGMQCNYLGTNIISGCTNLYDVIVR